MDMNGTLLVKPSCANPPGRTLWARPGLVKLSEPKNPGQTFLIKLLFEGDNWSNPLGLAKAGQTL